LDGKKIIEEVSDRHWPNEAFSHLEVHIVVQFGPLRGWVVAVNSVALLLVFFTGMLSNVDMMESEMRNPYLSELRFLYYGVDSRVARG